MINLVIGVTMNIDNRVRTGESASSALAILAAGPGISGNIGDCVLYLNICLLAGRCVSPRSRSHIKISSCSPQCRGRKGTPGRV